MAAAGTTTNLAVSAATGSGIATYQWQINNGNTGGNTNRLFFAPLAFANFSTNYKVIVSDGTLSATSSVVSVTPPAPSIVTSPTEQGGASRCRGFARGGSGHASRVGPTTQWKFNGTNVSGANYGGTTARTLTIASMQATNVGPYQVVVNDGFTPVSLLSSTANLTIALQPTISNSVSGTTLNMTFPTEIGPQYVLEWKGELTNGPWIPLSTNAGTGLPVTVGASTRTPPQRFFRIRMQ